MRTQVMNDPNAGLPWVEYYQVGGSRPIKLELSELPFVVGRDESADFTVDSSRVSRRHVMLDRQEGRYVLRDLDSTNGTYVNGKRIAETQLSDGDVIVIADFELTFFSGYAAARASATQVMTQPVSGGIADGNDLIIQVRRLHEALTHRSIHARFQPLARLDNGEVFGYEAVRELDDLPGQGRLAESIVEETECRLTERINQQHRLFSVEQATQLSESTHLFLGLQVSEISAEFLPDSLDRLSDIVAHKHQLVAQIPETAVCDIPYFRQFIQGLRDRDIKIAYGNFCGGPTQIASWHTVAPDFLKMAPSLVNGISRASGGWRSVQSLIQAMQELGGAAIATGIDNSADVQCLVELGCQYGQGEYFGAPQPITAFAAPNALVGIGQ
jgi:EAL domain-containing protein (putative c-di-GMP-specific phosphodiesterase class I)